MSNLSSGPVGQSSLLRAFSSSCFAVFWAQFFFSSIHFIFRFVLLTLSLPLQGGTLRLAQYKYNTIQIKLRWALFVTYTIIQSIMSEMCSLELTHTSAHTWSSGQPTVQRPGSSRGLLARAGIRTHNLGLSRVSSPTLYSLGHNCPKG